MNEDINITPRKKPTDHRQGKLVRLVDAIQRLNEIHHEDEYIIYEGTDKFHYNQKYADEIDDITRELNLFDITDIGNLYLTSGGRIVLDQGWGEYFNESDKVIFTLKELTNGMSYENFLKRIKEAKK